ncbi:MAG: type II secretion system inner membrane protein GspF [Gammaproteobacteria bacterium]|nr:type II secretion system inner membrane protein GspF [Gammaproteobacteria bacterium]
MPAFDYKAINKYGKETKGVLEADSAKSVRVKLREQDLIPISIEMVSDSQVYKKGLLSSLGLSFKLKHNKLKVSELALITRQLATLLSSGLPIDESLLAIIQQTESDKIARIMSAVRAKVLEGHSLSAGMAEYKSAFPEIYRATIHSGEHSGYLDMVLENLAEYTEKQFYFNQKIKQASIYPSLMITVSTAMVIMLLIYVVPQMVDVFKDTGHQLPFLTIALLNLSNFLQTFGIYLLSLFLALGLLFKKALQKKSNKYKYHKFLLRLPLFSKIIKVSNTARYARTFGILIQAGVSVLEAMGTANQVVTNLLIFDALEIARQKVKEGINISRALKETNYFPAMSIHLIASGESSGKLEAMLDRASNYQEKDIESLIATFISLFEPFMILTMGVVVLLIVLAILLPIFQMNQFVG